MTARGAKDGGMRDVAVIGAGPAGIAAALAAAASGADVLLVERGERLGGNVSQAFVHTICGLYLPSAEREAVHAHPGIPRAFAEALGGRGGAGPVEWAGAAAFVPIDPDAFADLAADACRAAGIDVRTGTSVTALGLHGAATSPFRVQTGPTSGGSGQTEERAAWTVVDTTGDANAATLLGAATEAAEPSRLQHASFIVRIDGVDTAGFDRMEGARTSTWLAREAARGRWPAGVSAVFRAALRRGSVFVTLNLPKPEGLRFDPLDAAVFDRLQENAHLAADALLEALRRERAPFRDAREGARPARVGIRETRRVRGLERLDVDAVLAGKRRDDEACVTTWPVELWSSSRRMEFRHAAGPASIPLGCLVADHPSRRLAMAGRCASAGHEALGAVRVVATSMAMGEAAGVACALAAAARSDLTAVPAARVRDVVAGGRTKRGLS